MIKLSIKNESEPQEKKEFKGTLYLEQDGDSINLMVDIEDDPNWYIIKIKPDGTFFRCGGLSCDIGIQVDDAGRIIEGESE